MKRPERRRGRTEDDGRPRNDLVVPDVKAKVAFLKSLGSVMGKREAVQCSRRISAHQLLSAMDTAVFSKAVLKLKHLSLRLSRISKEPDGSD